MRSILFYNIKCTKYNIEPDIGSNTITTNAKNAVLKIYGG